jgi:anaerobic magnesium-protoporphyrin IX monomethyl ester cyclase
VIFEAGMKVLLIYPEPDIAPFHLQAPLGCLYIAAALESKGHNVRIYDQNVDEQSVEDVIADFDPNIIGVSFTTACMKTAHKIAEKYRNSDFMLIAGGFHPTHNPKECVDAGYDIVARGEVEDTIHIVLDNINLRPFFVNQGFTFPPGYYYRMGDQYIDTGIASRSKNIDEYFPARHLLPFYYQRKYSHGVLIGSRGCNFGCVFCGSANTGYTSRNPKIVVDELEYIINHENQRNIFFADNIFTFNPEWVVDLCQEIIRRNISCHWASSSRSDIPERSWYMFDWMHKAGCEVLAFGIESAHQEALKTSNKGLKTGRIKPVLEYVRQSGISIRCNLMVGLPGSTLQDHLLSIDLMELLLPSQIVVSLNTPYPGTVMGKNPEKFGIHLKTSNWTTLLQGIYLGADKLTDVIEYKSITNEEIFQFLDILLKRMSYYGYISVSQDNIRLEKPERVIKTFLDKVPLPAIRNQPGRKEHYKRSSEDDWIL